MRRQLKRPGVCANLTKISAALPPFESGAKSLQARFHAVEERFIRRCARVIQPNLQLDAADLLRAFDINLDRIHAIAAKVYARGRRGSYDLNVAGV